MMNVDAKLGLNVFKIDSEPHIIIDHQVCQQECHVRFFNDTATTEIYTQDDKDDVQVNFEGCLECGACFIACSHEALTWHYPRPGYGIQYRFG
jgi:ferredoxin like protein